MMNYFRRGFEWDIDEKFSYLLKAEDGFNRCMDSRSIRQTLTINSKLHDRAEIEQYSEKKVVSLYKKTPKHFFNPTPTPKVAH